MSWYFPNLRNFLQEGQTMETACNKQIKWYVHGNYHIINAYRREKTLKGRNPDFRKNINKEECLCMNLSHGLIGFMTTITLKITYENN